MHVRPIINASQDHILHKMQYYKRLHDPENPYTQLERGHCEGLTATFLYAKWVSLARHPLIKEQDYFWFERTIQDLSNFSTLESSPDQAARFDQLYDKTSYFQHPRIGLRSTRQGEYHITMDNELGNQPKLEYTLTGSFKLGDLRTPLQLYDQDNKPRLATPLEILSQPYRLTRIQCTEHASGFVTDDQSNIFYYNANDPAGARQFDNYNLSQLERTLFAAHGYQKTAILGFKCFYFEDTGFHKPAFYPKRQQILENLKGAPSIPLPSQPDISSNACNLAKLNNCPESAAFYESKEPKRNPCYDPEQWKHLGYCSSQFFKKENPAWQKASLSLAAPAASAGILPER